MRNGIKTAPAAMPGGAAGAPTGAGPAPLRQAPQPVARATAPTDGTPAPKPKVYRCLNGGTIVANGCRTALRAGKEISDLHYDIRLLKRQGIRLELIEDDVEPSPLEPSAHRNGDIVVPGTPESDRASAENLRATQRGEALPPVPSPQMAR
jgi:hypothetical protein